LRHAIGLRAIPVVLVLVVMVYWLVRVRSKRQREILPPQTTSSPFPLAGKG
jgi:hypothetical protein